ncbi:MAG: hypothetical protein ACKVK4_05630, partial [Flavobacteriales bacterium]
PFIAKKWVDWLIDDINLEMKVRDASEAENSIAYLESQILTTNIVEQKTLLYQLIEEQAKTLMFAEVRIEYAFFTIDKAIVPEKKSGPSRPLFLCLGILFGGVLGCIIVLFLGRQKRLKLRLKN